MSARPRVHANSGVLRWLGTKFTTYQCLRTYTHTNLRLRSLCLVNAITGAWALLVFVLTAAQCRAHCRARVLCRCLLLLCGPMTHHYTNDHTHPHAHTQRHTDTRIYIHIQSSYIIQINTDTHTHTNKYTHKRISKRKIETKRKIEIYPVHFINLNELRWLIETILTI